MKLDITAYGKTNLGGQPGERFVRSIRSNEYGGVVPKKKKKKGMRGQEEMRTKKRDPKVGTGKKPKGSDRRLYTDENPKDTVRIKFATPADAKATVAKVKRINKPFARKIQILTVLEQRAKVAKKLEQARIAKAGKEAIRRAHNRKA